MAEETAPVANPVGHGKTPGIVTSGFVLSLLGFICGLPAVLGLIFGIVGLPQARRSGKGSGLAVASIVISAAWLVIGLAVLVGIASSGSDDVVQSSSGETSEESSGAGDAAEGESQDQGTSDEPLIQAETPDAQLAEETLTDAAPLGETCISGPELPPATSGGVLREVNVAEKDGDVAQGVGLTPDGKTAFVALEYADALAVVDLEANEVRDWIRLGAEPQGVDVTPDGCYVLAAAWDGYLYVISTESQQVEARIPGGQPEFIGWTHPDVVATPDNETAWVSERDTIKRINFRNGTLEDEIQVAAGEDIEGLALSSDGNIMFVSMTEYGEAREAFIAQVNLETRTSDFTIPISAEHMEIDRSDTRLLVGDSFDDTIRVLDVSDGSLLGEIPSPVDVRGIRSASDGTRIFVGGSSSGLLVEIGSPAE